jgi:hypothetical protein
VFITFLESRWFLVDVEKEIGQLAENQEQILVLLKKLLNNQRKFKEVLFEKAGDLEDA